MRTGNNGILYATFVNPVSGISTTATDVGVHVSDTESNVHVRTLDSNGNVIQECANVFSGCQFVVQSTSSYGVDLLFPGSGIAQVEFIDESPTGEADGFSIDGEAITLHRKNVI